MEGRLVTGEGNAADFVEMVRDELTASLGFRPFPGTLNIAGLSETAQLQSITIEGVGDDYCDGTVLRPCRLGGIRTAVIRPSVPDYPPDKTELLGPVHLRSLFDLTENDAVRLSAPDTVGHSWDRQARATQLDAFDAVVFDLDGTLVDLDVDWPTVHEEVKALLAGHLDRPFEEMDRLDVFDVAREAGLYADLDAMIASYELEGARSATARPLVDIVDGLDCPVGVCTANAVGAAERALERFGVLDAVDVIVGRDTLSEQKPAPEPLERCLTVVDSPAGNAVFVGDDESDARTATRAGTSFLPPAALSVPGASTDSTPGASTDSSSGGQ